jgi:hypothetical protein
VYLICFLATESDCLFFLIALRDTGNLGPPEQIMPVPSLADHGKVMGYAATQPLDQTRPSYADNQAERSSAAQRQFNVHSQVQHQTADSSQQTEPASGHTAALLTGVEQTTSCSTT